MNHEEYLALQRRRNEQIVKDRDKGMTFEEIGDKHGISKQRIQQIYKRAVS
jgi:DNA-directed RNA polymerase sigma subunit (sigma70/sigma32)